MTSHPESEAAEAYRMLRTAVVASSGVGPQVVLVTAAGLHAGVSTTAANLAACFAEGGRSVLAVAADRGDPHLHELLGMSDGPGLSDHLWPGVGLDEVIRPTPVPGLSLLAPGPRIDGLAPAAEALAKLLPAARALADVVILDTPPLLLADGASRLSALADTVLVVARTGRTDAAAASQAADLLRRLHAPTLGVVLVGPSRRHRSARHYFERSRAAAAARGSVDEPGEAATR